MATIRISYDEPGAVFVRVQTAFAQHAVERDEHTCVDALDELEGARLLASVIDTIREARGESDSEASAHGI